MTEGELMRDPAIIEEQRRKGWPDFHPEDYCHRCGQRNVECWYTDSALWNVAESPHLILCPQCFTESYEKATGEKQVWRLTLADRSDETAALMQSEAATRHELAEARAALAAASAAAVACNCGPYTPTAAADGRTPDEPAKRIEAGYQAVRDMGSFAPCAVDNAWMWRRVDAAIRAALGLESVDTSSVANGAADDVSR